MGEREENKKRKEENENSEGAREDKSLGGGIKRGRRKINCGQ